MKQTQADKGSSHIDLGAGNGVPDVRMIALTAIHVRDGNRPASGIDPDKLAELTDSIAARGVIQPIVVRRRDDGSFDLIAGERRVRASMAAQRTSIPAVLLPGGTEDVICELTALSENLQRQDIHPLDEAEGLGRLVGSRCHDVMLQAKHVAKWFGKSVDYVHRRLRLLKLVESIRQVWIDGLLNVGGAEMIARLPHDHQERVAARIEKDRNQLEGSAVNASLIAWWIEEQTDLLEAAPFDVADATLTDDAPSCFDCPKRLGFQGSLFEQHVSAGERCGDHACWEAKVAAHVDRARGGLPDGHLEATVRHGEHAGLLSPRDWRQARDEEEGEQVLMVDGPDAGAVVAGVRYDYGGDDYGGDDGESAHDWRSEMERHNDARRRRDETFRAQVGAPVMAMKNAKTITDTLADGCSVLLESLLDDPRVIRLISPVFGHFDSRMEVKSDEDWKAREQAFEDVKREVMAFIQMGTRQALQAVLLTLAASAAAKPDVDDSDAVISVIARLVKPL